MTDEEREDLNTFRHDLVKQARWWQWKAETLEKENEQLKAENAALRERLEKAVEVPSIERRFFGTKPLYAVIYRNRNGYVHTEIFCKRAEAEDYLAELKGEKNE